MGNLGPGTCPITPRQPRTQLFRSPLKYLREGLDGCKLKEHSPNNKQNQQLPGVILLSESGTSTDSKEHQNRRRKESSPWQTLALPLPMLLCLPRTEEDGVGLWRQPPAPKRSPHSRGPGKAFDPALIYSVSSIVLRAIAAFFRQFGQRPLSLLETAGTGWDTGARPSGGVASRGEIGGRGGNGGALRASLERLVVMKKRELGGAGRFRPCAGSHRTRQGPLLKTVRQPRETMTLPHAGYLRTLRTPLANLLKDVLQDI